YLRRNRNIAEESVRVKPIDDQKVKTLTSVTVKGKVKTEVDKLDEKYASGVFSGVDAYEFDLNDDPVAALMMDLFQYLQCRGESWQLTLGNGTGGQLSMSWRGGRPSLYLNEMQTDAQQIQNTPVTDVAYIKVFRPRSGVGFGGGSGGTIAIYTKKGGDQRSDPN